MSDSRLGQIGALVDDARTIAAELADEHTDAVVESHHLDGLLRTLDKAITINNRLKEKL